jgi:hypothetical protein
MNVIGGYFLRYGFKVIIEANILSIILSASLLLEEIGGELVERGKEVFEGRLFIGFRDEFINTCCVVILCIER